MACELRVGLQAQKSVHRQRHPLPLHGHLPSPAQQPAMHRRVSIKQHNACHASWFGHSSVSTSLVVERILRSSQVVDCSTRKKEKEVEEVEGKEGRKEGEG